MIAVTFAFPMILAAGAAVAAPVVIHLILRTRPRRIVFSAIQFVRKSHQATCSRQRLKQLLLLAMRMAAIGLIVLLVARAAMSGWRTAPGAAAPTAAAIVLDDSGSMSYSHRGRSLLARAKEAGRTLIGALPAGSRVAVLTTSGRDGGGGVLGDRGLASRQLADVPAGLGGQSVAAAMGRARGIVSRASLPRKAVYLLTDLTRRSWRDGGGVGQAEGVVVGVVHCGAIEEVNFALGSVEAPAAAPVGKTLHLDVSVAAANVGGEMTVAGEFDGEPIEPVPIIVPAGGAGSARLTVQTRREGVLHGKIALGRGDPLALDNVRYFTVRAQPPATVLLVRERSTLGAGDDTYRSMAAAVGAEPEWLRPRTATSDRLDAGDLSGVRVVMLCGVASPGPSQWSALGALVLGGGTLVVMAGPLLSPGSYRSEAARGVLPAAVKSQRPPSPPMGWRAPDSSHPLLAPLAGGQGDPLAEVRCRRRLEVESPASDGAVVVAFADGAPAVISRDCGRGRVWLWTTSPDRSFSDLAARPLLPILLLRTIELSVAGPRLAAGPVWGRNVSVPIPRGFESSVITVTGPGDAAPRTLSAATHRAVTLRADRLGPWTLRFQEDARSTARGFSVNADPAESDLTPADPAEVAALFPDGSAIVTDAPDALTFQQGEVDLPLDLTGPLLIALLVLLIGESFFANRFYKRPASQ